MQERPQVYTQIKKWYNKHEIKGKEVIPWEYRLIFQK
jgi:hypothetical protein